MDLVLKTLVFLLLGSSSLSAPVNGRNYDGYQVWRVIPSTIYQVKSLMKFDHGLDGLDLIDFWREATPSSVNRPVDIMVPPMLFNHVRYMLTSLNLDIDVIISDVGGLIASQMAENLERRKARKVSPGVSSLEDFDYTNYHTYDEIQQWVADIVAKYNDITSPFVVTRTYEGREVNSFRIRGRNSQPGATPPPAVWFQGGIHAREWISPATVMWFTAKLLEDYENGDDLAVQMFDNMDWYITPSLNADGYIYTWTQDRLWRKTRSDNFGDTNSGCKGADPNRNWPFGFGGNGTSPFPCSNIYHGPEALSEVEVAGVVDYLRNLKAGGQDFHIFLDWHSYGQYFLSPWSYSAWAPNPPDYDDMMIMANAAAQAIFDVHGTVFRSGSSIELLNEAAGSSKDWGYVPYDPSNRLSGGLGAKYSYTVELRDRGQYGFLLPASQIQEVGEEMYAGVRAMGDYILRELGFIA
ncbi:carboxypeptidase B-like [Diadema setosum]|uniref:carboxypeptidase B-like n=1 Tax=Diadema setosum TaxID=31175 RepID=UPI003B3B150F